MKPEKDEYRAQSATWLDVILLLLCFGLVITDIMQANELNRIRDRLYIMERDDAYHGAFIRNQRNVDQDLQDQINELALGCYP